MVDRDWKKFRRALLLSVICGSMATAWAGSVFTDAEIQAVMSVDERKIQEIRNEEIAQLKLTLSRRLPNARRADLYLRLAEIYIESYRSQYLLEGRAHEVRIEKNLPEKDIDHSRSRPFLMKAAEACREILDFKIAYERLDQVHFFLAYHYAEMGDEAKAKRHYQELIRLYPNSSYAGEALRELAERTFQQRDFRGALSLFEQALSKSAQTPGLESQLPRIHHRIAWCSYRLKQYPRAVTEMKEAIRLAGEGKEKLLSVKEEALRDLAIFMTESGDVTPAIDYFQKVVQDQNYYPRVLESLGRHYERNVEPLKAIQVYESLLKTNPENEAAFRVLVKLVDLDLRRARHEQALERIRRGKLLTSGSADTETAWQNLRAMIRRTATEAHERYRKEGDRKALEVSDRFYEAYLDPILKLSDPRKEASEIQMYLADVKRERGLSKDASALYRKVVESRDKRYAKEAAALWTASLADAIRKDSQAAGKSAAPVRTEASALELEFVQAADDLNASLKESAEAKEARLKAAQVLAAYAGSQKDAIKRIRGILDDQARSAQAVTGARLWLQIFADRLSAAEKKERSSKDSRAAWDDLGEVVAQIRKYAEVLSYDLEHGAKLKAALAEQDSRLKVLEISFREKDQDYHSAGKLYEKFAAESEAKDGASKAYENAVASYLKTNDLESADRTILAWQKRFPDSPAVAEAIRNSATLLFIQGKFEDSAASLERLGARSKNGEAFESSLRILAGTGSLESFSRGVSRFSEQFPQSPIRAHLNLLLAKKLESSSQDSAAAQAYKQCLGVQGSEDQAECAVRLGLLYLKGGLREEAKASFKQAIPAGQKGNALFFSAWSKSELAKMQDAEIQFDKLTREGLAKELPKRLAAFEALQKAYAPVLESGGSFSVGASLRLGQVAMDLATEMETIAPGDAKAAKIVETLRSTAVQFFKQSRQKALDGEWFSPDLPQLLAELSRAEKSVRAQGALPVLRWMEFSSPGKTDTASIATIRDQLSKNARDAQGWGRYGLWLAREGRLPGLAVIAFERVLALNPKSAEAINNLAVLQSGSGAELEDTWTAMQVNSALKEAAALEDPLASVITKFNRGQLLNYYGMHGAAKKLWDVVQAKDSSALALDGWAVSLQGTGNLPQAKSTWLRANQAGADERRFVQKFHEASAAAVQNQESCLDLLSDIRASQGGFEKVAARKLEETCKTWKQNKSN